MVSKEHPYLGFRKEGARLAPLYSHDGAWSEKLQLPPKFTK